MSVEEYVSKVIAAQLVQELEPILRIKAVTSNTELLGACTEAALRRLSRRVVYPLHVSTGAVLDYPMPTTLRQVDPIIWASFPAPSVFEVDDFALVPRSNAFGAIEIKRSNYRGTDKELERFVDSAPALIAASQASVGDSRSAAILCVIKSKPSSRLEKLFKEGKVVATFDNRSSRVAVRSKDVRRLINFLHYTSWRYRRQAAQPTYPQLVACIIREVITNDGQ
jgi:hypothetical protein